VQVGPFKTREEIESARAKLRALGMDPGIMISMRK
jgi:cell division protein FtsN